MTIEKISKENELTLIVSGRLDTSTAPQLENEIKENVEGVTLLVLDFGALDYLSSAGLRVLLQAQKTMNKQGEMIVKNVNETVNEVLDITGFLDILTVE